MENLKVEIYKKIVEKNGKTYTHYYIGVPLMNGGIMSVRICPMFLSKKQYAILASIVPNK